VEGAASLISTLAGFDGWRREKFVPHEWAERLKALRDLLPAPVISGAASREQVEAWRSTARALDAVEEALDAAAVALSGSGQVPLGSFWRQVETVLALEPLRIADRRRDVVHVMDVFEARQWELPVVLVCGLTERHFPQYHREDPLIGDAERRRLGLDTAADRQSQERFLFDLAITRASEEVILSYPRFDEKGEETLPSFFLDSVGEAKDAPARIRPKPHRNACVAPPAPVTDPLLLQGLAEAHFSLSPTSIESFLQCPFQFFAKRTLRLRTRPAAPRDRLDALLQGSILHRALAEWTLAPLLGEQILGRVFDEECARMRVPQTYRTEAVRLELLRNFLAFVADRRVNLPGWVTRVEQSFRYPLHGGLSISGRIDRLEESPARHAVVIDYKYSAANRIRDHVEETGAGARVQAGLYLAAVGRVFGLIPAGMLFCGLKKAVAWDGWHRNLAGLEGIGESCTESVLDGMIREAEETAARAYESITAGRIAVEPADRQKCEWCDYHDICRVETISTVRKAGGA
jgi:ATP-dependent helicase/DNAse subunit B